MKKSIITILMLLSLGIVSSNAQTADSTKNPSIMAGLHGGISTGYGFSYRQWLENSKFGFQATTLPLFFGSYSIVNLGLTGLYNLRSNPEHRFFVWGSNHTVIANGENYISIFGMGPGIEFSGKYLTISLQAGYGFAAPDGVAIPSGEIGLYYNIK